MKPPRWRRPTRPEMALQVALCALLALFGSDLLNALGAEACSVP